MQLDVLCAAHVRGRAVLFLAAAAEGCLRFCLWLPLQAALRTARVWRPASEPCLRPLPPCTCCLQAAIRRRLAAHVVPMAAGKGAGDGGRVLPGAGLPGGRRHAPLLPARHPRHAGECPSPAGAKQAVHSSALQSASLCSLCYFSGLGCLRAAPVLTPPPRPCPPLPQADAFIVYEAVEDERGLKTPRLCTGMACSAYAVIECVPVGGQPCEPDSAQNIGNGNTGEPRPAWLRGRCTSAQGLLVHGAPHPCSRGHAWPAAGGQLRAAAHPVAPYSGPPALPSSPAPTPLHPGPLPAGVGNIGHFNDGSHNMGSRWGPTQGLTHSWRPTADRSDSRSLVMLSNPSLLVPSPSERRNVGSRNIGDFNLCAMCLGHRLQGFALAGPPALVPNATTSATSAGAAFGGGTVASSANEPTKEEL